jgi:hypothetical protein
MKIFVVDLSLLRGIFLRVFIIDLSLLRETFSRVFIVDLSLCSVGTTMIVVYIALSGEN